MILNYSTTCPSLNLKAVLMFSAKVRQMNHQQRVYYLKIYGQIFGPDLILNFGFLTFEPTEIPHHKLHYEKILATVDNL